MGPKTKTVERDTVSTPLAEDLVGQIRGMLAEGAFGLEAGPQQRQAGTAIDQFVTMLQTRLMDPNRIGPLEEGAARRTNRQAADQREAFGAAGNRYSSVLGNAEALLRSEAATSLNELAFQNQQADTEALLQGITQMFSQGAQSRNQQLDLLLPLALAGILPPEVIASPGFGDQLLSGIIQGGAAYLGAQGGGG